MVRGAFGLPRVPQRRAVSPWTRERIRHLRRWWTQGARVREIAAELGHGITANAVIAKIHRLGIADRSPYGGGRGRRYAAKSMRLPAKGASADRLASWWRKGPPPGWVVRAKPYVEDPGSDAKIPRRRRRALLNLTDETCRWPVGDPASSRFFFCGAEPAPKQPYCAEHCARAYRRARRARISKPSAGERA